MNLEVKHTTRYRYSAPVSRSQHLVHLSPRDRFDTGLCQRVHYHDLNVAPVPALRRDTTDSFGNAIVMLDIESAHTEFVLDAVSRVETQRRPAINLTATSPWDVLQGGQQDWPQLRPPIDLDVIQFRSASALTIASPEIADYVCTSFPAGRPVLDGGMDLVLRIFREFKFDPTATDVATPTAQAFKLRRGVCQDFSHVALSCLRALRIPCRYVSGYLLTRPPPGQQKLQGADASHAWISIWAPETGWVDFDPTNGLIVQDEHVTVAYGRDYIDVSPISGVLIGGGAHTVSVSVDVGEIL
jgi:transglutaminase-like putative cysteine protease